MPVYVDDFNANYRGMIMCHMVADTLAELHEMADRIGIQRKWFQCLKKASYPHYDICLSKKALAIKSGAVPLSLRENKKLFIEKAKKLKAEYVAKENT